MVHLLYAWPAVRNPTSALDGAFPKRVDWPGMEMKATEQASWNAPDHRFIVFKNTNMRIIARTLEPVMKIICEGLLWRMFAWAFVSKAILKVPRESFICEVVQIMERYSFFRFIENMGTEWSSFPLSRLLSLAATNFSLALPCMFCIFKPNHM